MQVKRKALNMLKERVKESPVVLIQGARSVGKSTVLRELANIYNAEVLDFDIAQMRDFASSNVSTLFEGKEVVFIDEYQRVPEVLDAIKSRLNLSSRSGQFVISGSISYDALTNSIQALTGRLDRVDILPFSQSEIGANEENFVQKLVDNPENIASEYNAQGLSKNTRSDYMEMLCRGGFPLALNANSVSARRRWFENYIHQSLNRDVSSISRVHDLRGLEGVAKRLAKTTGSVLNIANIAREIEIDDKTTKNYISLLEKIFMVFRLPISKAIETKKLLKSPKIHFVDTGIASHLLGLNEGNINDLRPDTITRTGNLYETFAVQEIIKLANVVDEVKTVGYRRTQHGEEIDLILELWSGQVIAVEVKAAQRVDGRDYTALRKYQELAGERFKCGLLLHSGIGAVENRDKVITLPLDCLWR
jgi:predicted AAA+ superfamily ATPase